MIHYSGVLQALGVSIESLERHARRSLLTVEKFWKNKNFGPLVISSTNGGKHSAGSLHYANCAYDLWYPLFAEWTNNYSVQLLQEFKATHEDDFDIVFESDHIHIEYDPK